MNGKKLPLSGQTALITRVSRRSGVGFAAAKRLAQDGASIFISHYSTHDEQQPWKGDNLDALRHELSEHLTVDASFADISLDLAGPDAPSTLMEHALALTGSLEIMICNHARSGSDGSILDINTNRLDDHFFVNTRSTVLLTSLFAQAFSGLRGGLSAAPGDTVAPDKKVSEYETGRVIWLTSSQARPMPGEIAYAMSKAALAGLVRTAASELVRLGILLNAINPGPVNTGYLNPSSTDRSTEVLEEILETMPHIPRTYGYGPYPVASPSSYGVGETALGDYY
ncbi:SDR family oxidoreductase [Lysinibacter sp. HNR]|uniref:SDR family oxidoreductase n=1 Tax=Lysinibacter sp. HNR TaxID=3031408 RepID=UPI00243540E1|nr:SDR family oxidoreductase [Lysinibacter sp. HNR]WGD37374.1 SDR family oxidoreductase [Lysinibacter sp. HNR]